MSVPPNQLEDADVAGDLIAGLESEASLVDRGRFTFTLAQAHEKLAAYRLGDPDALLLLLIEVAHLLPDCAAISFELGRLTTRVTLVGAELSASELHSVFDGLFLDLCGLEPEAARRGFARRQLASALNTALGLRECALVELCSTLAGGQAAWLRFRPGAEPEFGQGPGAAGQSSLTLTLHERRPRIGRAEHVHARRALLESRGSRASKPVLVDGRPIHGGPVPNDWVDAIAVRDDFGRTLGHAGWSEASADTTTLMFVANGVILETLLVSDWGERSRGFAAVVEAGDLGRDLSQLKLLRDAAFEQRVALVESALDRMPSAAPLRYDGPGERVIGEPKHFMILGAVHIGSLTALFALPSIFPSVVSVAAVAFLTPVAFLVLPAVMLWLRAVHHRVVSHGTPLVGTVLATERSGEHQGQPIMKLDVAIPLADGETTKQTFHALFSSLEHPLLQPGCRVFLRADPKHPNLVRLARKPKPMFAGMFRG